MLLGLMLLTSTFNGALFTNLYVLAQVRMPYRYITLLYWRKSPILETIKTNAHLTPTKFLLKFMQGCDDGISLVLAVHLSKSIWPD